MFTNYNTGEVRVVLGLFLLGVFVCFIIYNSIIMLICLCHNIILWLRRCTTQSRRMKLKKETKKIIGKIKEALRNLRKKAQEHPEELTKAEKDWFVPDKEWFFPDDIGDEWDLVTNTETGGLQLIIV